MESQIEDGIRCRSVLLLDADETVSEAAEDDDDDARAVQDCDWVTKVHCTKCNKKDLMEGRVVEGRARGETLERGGSRQRRKTSECR